MRQHLEPADIVGEIRMQRSLDPRAVMLVEGDTDARFFAKFVDHETCDVVASHGRAPALEVLRALNLAGVAGVVAIVDADFGRFANTLETDSNLYFADGHDLDVMLVRSPAFDRVVAEHASEERVDAFLSGEHSGVPLSTVVLRAAIPIGAALLTSLEGEFGLRFDGLSFQDFVDRKTLEIDVEKLVVAVMNKSSQHSESVRRGLIQGIESHLRRSPEEKWELARGCDCVDVLVFSLQGTIASKKSRTLSRPRPFTDSESIARELRLAFGEMEFRATRLFGSLVEWEQGNSKYRILS